MAGILKVDQYQDFNGNNIMTSDGSGNITINAAAMKMTPAFMAYKSSNQSLSNNTQTTLTYDSTDYNTDSFWDTSTNRATIPSGQAGKYFFYGQFMATMGENVAVYKLQIDKNGSYVNQIYTDSSSSEYKGMTFTYTGDFSAGDYFTFSLLGQASDGGGTVTVIGTTGQRYNFVAGYKLIGV